MKHYLLVSGILLMLLLVAVAPASAATPEEIEASVVKGLAWLDLQQNQGDGSWGSWGSYCRVAQTGLAVLKFEDRAYELGFDSPLDEGYEYHDNVANGLDFLQDNVQLDGSIWDLVCGQTYETSIAVMALSQSGAADGIGEAVQDAVTWLITTQKADGGWRYPAGGSSDQSNSGWATLALVYAQNGYGVDISPTMQEPDPDLHDWVSTIQCKNAGDDYGGSGYDSACYWVNILKTGNLLYQFAMLGKPVTDSDVNAAIGYIEKHWTAAGDGSEGWKNHCQAMYTLMKGLEAYDIDLIDTDGDGIRDDDWFDQVSTHLISMQNPIDGSWPNDPWASETLPTSWALLTLEKFVIPPTLTVSVDFKPTSCPNSFYVKEKGVLPVAILGSNKYDITKINPATIRLHLPDSVPETGVAPLRWAYEDVSAPTENSCSCGYACPGPDGLKDLTLKFNAPAVIQTLEPSTMSGCVKLQVSGNLYGDEPGETGQKFAGSDFLRLLQTKVV